MCMHHLTSCNPYIKVVTSRQMAAIEAAAYKEGCQEETFMENAGKGVAACADQFCRKHKLQRRLFLLAGKGNNGGDAHVAGRYLLQNGYEVVVYQVGTLEECSPLCRKNFQRLKECGADMRFVAGAEEIAFSEKGLIIDALFGTGLHSAPREPYASIIEKANAAGLPILAVDIPSGLDGDTGSVLGVAIRAHTTIFLGLPKRGFFLDQGWNHVGILQRTDFGLPTQEIEKVAAELLMFDESNFCQLIPSPVRNRHKYQAGYIVGIAGSPGMAGAALLSSSAALRAGAGIVRLLYPKGMEGELSSSPYELIKTPYEEERGLFASVFEHLQKASALFIGPGIGLSAQSKKLLQMLLPQVALPLVIDADALNIIATLGLQYPERAIITPHSGEMRRLLQSNEKGPVNEAFLQACQHYVEEKRVTLVLKGGPSFILHPGEPAVVVPYGNPGMATAGSGDALTGIIAALLACGISTREAALCGVFAHAYAGDRAAEVKTPFSLLASDIIAHLPHVFKLLRHHKPGLF